MILVDTSVWIDHLRKGHRGLVALLEAGEVLVHPFVAGELACASLRNRAAFLALLEALPGATVATHDEAMRFLETHRLAARGLGYVDVHLLATAHLDRCRLLTLDRRLAREAARLRVAA